jgi:thiol-disulfide isomerase/thioredoxin
MKRFALLLAFGACVWLWPALGQAKVLTEVRALLAQGQLDLARQRISSQLSQGGVNSELLEAMSWMARSELNRKDYDAAQRDAEQVSELAAPLASGSQLDADPHLSIAVGAALEVRAQAMAAHGESQRAVELLRRELRKYEKTSIALRLQKNINLLTLEGKPAPELVIEPHLGNKPVPLRTLRGKPVLLFFWADWCGDCKMEGPIVAQLYAELSKKGLVVVAPTQVYGAEPANQDAPSPDALLPIEAVRQKYYAGLADVPVPVSAANFRSYGASTVPTLVLINPKGEVVLYHPGRMSYQELNARLQAVLPP